MAGSFSDYLELELLDHVFRQAAYSAPANIFVALCTSPVSDSNTGSTITECDYTGYARVSTTSTDWDVASSGATANATAIAFPQKTDGEDDTATYFALCDAATVGNMLAWGELTTSRVIVNGAEPTFAIGELDVTLT